MLSILVGKGPANGWDVSQERNFCDGILCFFRYQATQDNSGTVLKPDHGVVFPDGKMGEIRTGFRLGGHPMERGTVGPGTHGPHLGPETLIEPGGETQGKPPCKRGEPGKKPGGKGHPRRPKKRAQKEG